MVLLLVLALGMLSLSTINLRISGASNDREIARSNARLAMMTALGELQKLAGSDTRVTAPADALAGSTTASPYVTGVWRSWEGKDHDTDTGLPFAPDYGSKEDSYDSSSDGRFLGWLLSGSSGNDATSPPDIDEGTDTIPLVGEGVFGSGSGKEVHVIPTDVGDDGAMAWWIQGENQKALMKESLSEPSDNAGWSERLASNGRPDTEDIGITDDAELAKAVSRQSLNLATPLDSNRAGIYFHDITTYSRGLLTNTATGGWRRDLSLMTEQWNNLANANLPFFTLEPGIETSASKANGAIGGLIYPWAVESDFTASAQGSKTYSQGASVGWNALVDYAKQYEDIDSSSTADNVIFSQTLGDRRDEITLLPVLARIHWVLSFSATAQSASVYNALIHFDPVVTYWNPYDVALSGTTDAFWIQLETTIPYTMKFTVGSDTSDTKEISRFTHHKNNLTFNIPADGEVWQPGEARVYSLDGTRANNRYNLMRGYSVATGFARTITAAAGGNLQGGPSDTLTVELGEITTGTFKFDAVEWRGNRSLTTNSLGDALAINYVIDYADANSYWGNPLGAVANTTQTLSALASSGDPSPFMVQKFQLQNINDATIESKGYSNRKPILNHVTNQSTSGTLSDSLDTFPYDVVVSYPNGGLISTADGLPSTGATDSDPHSYIGTSPYVLDGLTSLITAEIPKRPLRSLGELLNFDLNGYNPAAPQVANPIGNSSASYMIEPDEVFIADSMSASERVSYDHSYVGNHLFFDDWFVSSIAPETNGYSATAIRDTTTVLSEFLSETEELPNRAYKPANILSESEASTMATDLFSDSDTWHSVASEIEVEGMFNVNSTSVEAWTALLKHQRDADVPYLASGSTTLASTTGHPASRTTVAGDPGAAGAPYNEAGTHMVLTDSQIEALATEIVNQVKLRGPFLSLSEFMNRRLVGGSSDLALSGAVESALNELRGRGASENPFLDLESTFAEVVFPGQGAAAYPAAAAGNRAYGFPGWIRQADVLRPLAPILSARDDTFTIRAYGASMSGSTVTAEAWCEAVVQRKASYVDEADDTSILPSDTTLTSEANKIFGRKFEIISFRWLSPDEI
ncbi:MAG: hypothetical protein ACSHX7_11210 [Luteolibacter sp.]